MTLTIGRERTFAGESFAGNRPRVNYRSLFPAYGSTYITTFFEVAPSATTHGDVSGTDRISSLDDYRIGYGLLASQATSGKRPAYQATGGPNGRPAAYFVSSRADELNLPGEAEPTADHFVACLFNAPANSGATYDLIGTDVGDTGRHQLRLLSTGVLVYNMGTNGTEATPNVVRPNDIWCLAIGSWQASSERARVELLHAGAWLRDSDVQAGAVVGTGSMYIGRGLNGGKIALAITGKVPILESSSDGDYERLREDIIKYTEDRFGMVY